MNKKQLLLIFVLGIIALGIGGGLRYVLKSSAPNSASQKTQANSTTASVAKESHLIYAITDLEHKGQYIIYKSNLNNEPKLVSRISLLGIGHDPFEMNKLIHPSSALTPAGLLFFIDAENRSKISRLNLETGDITPVFEAAPQTSLVALRASDNGNFIVFSDTTGKIVSYDITAKKQLALPLSLAMGKEGVPSLIGFCSGSDKIAFGNYHSDGSTGRTTILIRFYDVASGADAGSLVLSEYTEDKSGFNERFLYPERLAPDCSSYVEYIENSDPASYTLVMSNTGERKVLAQRTLAGDNASGYSHFRFSGDGSQILANGFGNSKDDATFPAQLSGFLTIFPTADPANRTLYEERKFGNNTKLQQAVLAPDNLHLIFVLDGYLNYEVVSYNLATGEQKILQKNQFPISHTTVAYCFGILAAGGGTPDEEKECNRVLEEETAKNTEHSPLNVEYPSDVETWIYLGFANIAE